MLMPQPLRDLHFHVFAERRCAREMPPLSRHFQFIAPASSTYGMPLVMKERVSFTRGRMVSIFSQLYYLTFDDMAAAAVGRGGSAD